MIDTAAFTSEHARKLDELYDAIVGTAKAPGMGEGFRRLRDAFDEHAAGDHEDPREAVPPIAAAAAAAAVSAHEQHKFHRADSRRHGAARFFYGAAQSLVAVVGATAFFTIVGSVIWLGPLLEALRRLAGPQP